MRPSRGMGAIEPSKMPSGRKKARRDDTDFTQFKDGGLAKQAATAISMKEKGVKPKKMAAGGLYENIHKKQERIAAGPSAGSRTSGRPATPPRRPAWRASRSA